MTTKRRSTSDGLGILQRRYVRGRPEVERAVEEATLNALIAQALYDLRSQARLTQKQLAARVGTSHSVISRLEDSDYTGHSLGMLQRVCRAMGHRVQLRLVPLPGQKPVRKGRASA